MLILQDTTTMATDGPGEVDSKGVEGTGAMAIKRAGCTGATHGVGACTAVVLPWWPIRRLSYICT